MCGGAEPTASPGTRTTACSPDAHTCMCDLLSTKPWINLVTKKLWLCNQNPSVLVVVVFLEKTVVALEHVR